MPRCRYIVWYVPPGCTAYREGEELYTDCPEDDTCRELIVDGEGICDGTWAVNLSCTCEPD